MLTPLLVAGVFPLDREARERWGPAAAWQLPVGDPHELGATTKFAEPPFQLNRGLQYEKGRVTHQGADLANGRAGDTVRAAASGLVVLALDGDNGNGYGGHLVLAHRLEHGGIAYSVYGHLQAGTIAVHPGAIVCAGEPLARVGQTGRASCPHLHFEVRRPADEDERWEKARITDPLAFVREHGSQAPPDAGPAGVYVDWARSEGLIPADAAAADAPLLRGTWWRMLAGALRDGPGTELRDDTLRDSLMEAGLLPDEESDAPARERLAWSECARDLKRLHQRGVRIPHGPLAKAAHEASCVARYGQREPADHTGALRHRQGDPTLRDACMLIADVSGPAPEPDLRARRPGHRHPGAAPGAKTASRRKHRHPVARKPGPRDHGA